MPYYGLGATQSCSPENRRRVPLGDKMLRSQLLSKGCRILGQDTRGYMFCCPSRTPEKQEEPGSKTPAPSRVPPTQQLYVPKTLVQKAMKQYGSACTAGKASKNAVLFTCTPKAAEGLRQSLARREKAREAASPPPAPINCPGEVAPVNEGVDWICPGVCEDGGDAVARFDETGGWTGQLVCSEIVAEDQTFEPSAFDNAIEWVKTHPVLSAGIGAAIVGGGYLVLRSKR